VCIAGEDRKVSQASRHTISERTGFGWSCSSGGRCGGGEGGFEAFDAADQGLPAGAVEVCKVRVEQQLPIVFVEVLRAHAPEKPIFAWWIARSDGMHCPSWTNRCLSIQRCICKNFAEWRRREHLLGESVAFPNRLVTQAELVGIECLGGMGEMDKGF